MYLSKQDVLEVEHKLLAEIMWVCPNDTAEKTVSLLEGVIMLTDELLKKEGET